MDLLSNAIKAPGFARVFVVLVPSLVLVLMAQAIKESAIGLQLVLGATALAFIVMMAMLNGKVGYRWFDVAFLVVPVYGAVYAVKVIWRGVGLPDAYWAEPLPLNDAYRLAAAEELVEQGVSPDIASAVGLVLFPVDDENSPNELFEEELDRSVLETASKVNGIVDNSELKAIVKSALQVYVGVASKHGNGYYEARFKYALDELSSNSFPRRVDSAPTSEHSSKWHFKKASRNNHDKLAREVATTEEQDTIPGSGPGGVKGI